MAVSRPIYEIVEPLQIESHQVERRDSWHHTDIDYEHLRDDKKNEWDEWLNDVDSRGGLNEQSNKINGSGWEIDYGWQRNRVRNYFDEVFEDDFQSKEPHLREP